MARLLDAVDGTGAVFLDWGDVDCAVDRAVVDCGELAHAHLIVDVKRCDRSNRINGTNVTDWHASRRLIVTKYRLLLKKLLGSYRIVLDFVYS